MRFRAYRVLDRDRDVFNIEIVSPKHARPLTGWIFSRVRPRKPSRLPQWEHGRACRGGKGGKGDPATLPNRYGVTFCLFTFDYTIWHTFTRSDATRRPAERYKRVVATRYSAHFCASYFSQTSLYAFLPQTHKREKKREMFHIFYENSTANKVYGLGKHEQ